MVSRRELGLAVLATSVCLGARFSPYRLVVVSGGSMQPALNNHQIVVMEREPQPLGTLRRGDVVVFHHRGETLIKRVRAVGGDSVTTVRFSNGLTSVMGDLGFPESTILRFARSHPGAVRIATQQVPPGCLYVVGDNLNSSIDSREFGAVPAQAVVGRIVTADGSPASRQAPHRVAACAASGLASI